MATLHTRKVDITWCPYCRRSVRGNVFFWDDQARLYFDTRDCAEKWRERMQDQEGNPTFPGMTIEDVNGIRPKRSIKAWFKRLFSVDS